MRISIEEFRKRFPNLAREILDEQDGASITLSFSTSAAVDPWRGYVPGPIDYLRRAKTVEEAREVIEYLLRHGEITEDEARQYLALLDEKGLDAFGPRKDADYYYRVALEYWRLLALQEHMRRIAKKPSGVQQRQRS